MDRRRRPVPTEPDWLRELTRTITVVTRLAHSNRLYDAMGARAGLDVRPYLFGILSRIRDLQPVRISDVAEEMGYDRSTVSRHVAELVALDCVGRSVHPTDGRVVMLELTDRGEAALARVYDAWNVTLAEITADWQAGDKERFLTLLQRFGDSLGAHVAEL